MTTNPGRSGVSPSSAGQKTETPDRVTPLLKGALPPALIVGAIAVIIAAIVAGGRGALGALLGVAIVVLFSGTGLWAMRLVRTQDPMLVMVVGMASYTARIILFGVAIALTGVIQGIDGVLDRRITAFTVVACVIAWVIGEIRAFTKMRIPTFDVSLPTASGDGSGSRGDGDAA